MPIRLAMKPGVSLHSPPLAEAPVGEARIASLQRLGAGRGPATISSSRM
jgi:hypothetical protein